jgi:hypothetical protein
MSKDDIIRFRCEGELRARFEAVAKLERREPADLARLVLEDYIAAKEFAIKGDSLRDAPPSSKNPAPAVHPVVGIVKSYGKPRKASK